MLWQDLKKPVYKQKPTNLNELKEGFEEEWVKVPPQFINKKVIAVEGGFYKLLNLGAYCVLSNIALIVLLS